MPKAIPIGYHTLTPTIVVRDARQAIAFYRRALGAEERFVMPGPEGQGIMHAELKIGDSVFMLGEEGPYQPCKSAATLGSSPVNFFLYVEDVDAAFRTAVLAGAIGQMPPEEMFWGDRTGTVQDPFGHTWTLATHTRDVTERDLAAGAQAAFVEMNEGNLVIRRSFAAPRELVWRSWTEPERLKQWWGPKDYTAPACRIDLRVGGSYLCSMRSSDGQEIWSTGTYRELVAPSRLVCTDSFADRTGNAVPAAQYGMPGDWTEEMVITLTLEERAGLTTLTLEHAGIPKGEQRGLARLGWNESFDKLAAILR